MKHFKKRFRIKRGTSDNYTVTETTSKQYSLSRKRTSNIQTVSYQITNNELVFDCLMEKSNNIPIQCDTEHHSSYRNLGNGKYCYGSVTKLRQNNEHSTTRTNNICDCTIKSGILKHNICRNDEENMNMNRDLGIRKDENVWFIEHGITTGGSKIVQHLVNNRKKIVHFDAMVLDKDNETEQIKILEQRQENVLIDRNKFASPTTPDFARFGGQDKTYIPFNKSLDYESINFDSGSKRNLNTTYQQYSAQDNKKLSTGFKAPYFNPSLTETLTTKLNQRSCEKVNQFEDNFNKDWIDNTITDKRKLFRLSHKNNSNSVCTSKSSIDIFHLTKNPTEAFDDFDEIFNGIPLKGNNNGATTINEDIVLKKLNDKKFIENLNETNIEYKSTYFQSKLQLKDTGTVIQNDDIQHPDGIGKVIKNVIINENGNNVNASKWNIIQTSNKHLRTNNTNFDNATKSSISSNIHLSTIDDVNIVRLIKMILMQRNGYSNNEFKSNLLEPSKYSDILKTGHMLGALCAFFALVCTPLIEGLCTIHMRSMFIWLCYIEVYFQPAEKDF